MANSRTYRLITDSLKVDNDLLPATTPGTLGRLDAGDPDIPSRIGDTPGSLGLNDQGDPDIVRYRLIPTFAEFDAFEAAVLAYHMQRAARRTGHQPLAEIPAEELEQVEGRFKLRRGAAEKCRALLRNARADLAKEKTEFTKKNNKEREEAEKLDKANNWVPVSQVEKIGLSSAYRGVEQDAELWHRYFRGKYYWATERQRARLSRLEGGAHGWKDVEQTVAYVAKRKAAPGFSNHTNGTAVDFFTVEDGKTLQAETGNSEKELQALNARWARSWLYRWLQAHKSEYGTDRIDTEAWHWEFTLPAKGTK